MPELDAFAQLLSLALTHYSIIRVGMRRRSRYADLPRRSERAIRNCLRARIAALCHLADLEAADDRVRRVPKTLSLCLAGWLPSELVALSSRHGQPSGWA
ncbi:hypothetical protein [Amycolatopsis sp. NPDC049868]|uniref:hypothetical protein n=1 Tax=Amycolatopsis sp. NPDC049868 TaxID=3363934 RepID=UPI0037B57081